MNAVFANQDDEDAIYPLTRREIAVAKKHDPNLHSIADKHGYTKQLVENKEIGSYAKRIPESGFRVKSYGSLCRKPV